MTNNKKKIENLKSSLFSDNLSKSVFGGNACYEFNSSTGEEMYGKPGCYYSDNDYDGGTYIRAHATSTWDACDNSSQP